ncbi:hypothetical protein [Streptomyces sp. NPDC059957]|uniref:hypothetical protein n=1 Tax=unclassified Streptomyces TaxID=2593676 RepID=UPI003655E3E6
MDNDVDTDPDFPYWGIDMPGLRERQAFDVADLIRQSDADIVPTLVNPKLWLTLHLDRETVEAMRDALMSTEQTIVTASLTESLDEWLEWSADVS